MTGALGRLFLLLVIAAIVTACGTGDEGSAAADPTASPDATSASAAPSEPEASESPEDGAPPDSIVCTPPEVCGGTMTPGEYVSDALGATVTFSVEEGWRSGPELDEVGFYLEREDAGGPHAMTVTRFDGEVFAESCNSADATETIDASASAFVEWLAAREGITAEEPVETTIGDHAAIQVDLTTTLPAECTEPPWIWLWVLPEVGDFHLEGDESARFIAADVGDTTVVVVIEAFPDVDYEAYLAEAMAVVDTMTVETP